MSSGSCFGLARLLCSEAFDFTQWHLLHWSWHSLYAGSYPDAHLLRDISTLPTERSSKTVCLGNSPSVQHSTRAAAQEEQVVVASTAHAETQSKAVFKVKCNNTWRMHVLNAQQKCKLRIQQLELSNCSQVIGNLSQLKPNLALTVSMVLLINQNPNPDQTVNCLFWSHWANWHVSFKAWLRWCCCSLESSTFCCWVFSARKTIPIARLGWTCLRCSFPCHWNNCESHFCFAALSNQQLLSFSLICRQLIQIMSIKTCASHTMDNWLCSNATCLSPLVLAQQPFQNCVVIWLQWKTLWESSASRHACSCPTSLIGCLRETMFSLVADELNGVSFQFWLAPQIGHCGAMFA